MILEDIAKYKLRIQIACEKMEELPDGPLPYKQHMPIAQKRKDLQAEIINVQKMIGYANETLS